MPYKDPIKLKAYKKEWDQKKRKSDPLYTSTRWKKLKEWRKNNPEHNKKTARVYNRMKWRTDPEWRKRSLQKCKESYQRRRDKVLAYMKIQRSTIPYQARKALCDAIANGRIDRPTECSKCHKKAFIQGHHADYNKPFDVEWLCGFCHGKVHQLST